MSWIGLLILVVGIARTIRAAAGLQGALRSHGPGLVDWSFATAIWIAWCAVAVYLTMAGFGAVWPVIALAALLGINLLLGFRWRVRQSTSASR